MRFGCRGSLQAEGLAKLRLLVRPEVSGDQLEMRTGEALSDPVLDPTGGQQEERRRAFGDRGFDVIDELLLDADVAERSGERSDPCPDGRTDQRDEEEDAEQEAPERAA